MSCNSCSNVTLPGVAGPAGPAGANGSNGVGITSIVWTSNSNGDPAGTEGTTDTYTINYTNGTTATFIVTNGADGTNGTNGVSLINTITAPVETTVAAVGGYENLASWSVPANTLKDTGDTLRLQLKVLPKKSDSEKVYVNIEVGSSSVPIELSTTAPYDIRFMSFLFYTLQVDMIKISDTQLRVEWTQLFEQQLSDDYSNGLVSLYGFSSGSSKSGQVITTNTMISNTIPVNIELQVTNASFPAKLLMAKLYFFKKL